jgi:hypothetical protein
MRQQSLFSFNIGPHDVQFLSSLFLIVVGIGASRLAIPIRFYGVPVIYIPPNQKLNSFETKHLKTAIFYLKPQSHCYIEISEGAGKSVIS